MHHSIIQEVNRYGSQRLKEDLFRLVGRYPSLKLCSIGQSVMGKNIYAVRISDPALHHPYQAVHVQLRKHQWNGSFHANEWITTPLLMKLIEELADAWHLSRALRDRDIRTLLTDQIIWIVPMVNPDGVDLVLDGFEHWIDVTHDSSIRKQQLVSWNDGSHDFTNWKANIRGVDLNDQFPAHWIEEVARRQITSPSMRDYAGPRPLTEPEAQAMATFTLYHEFDQLICLHTQGQEIYWNYREMEPTTSLQIAERLAKSCGYKALAITDSDAGFKDWFIQEFGKPGFTVEVGRGVNPLPIEQFAKCYDEVSELLLTSLEREEKVKASAPKFD